METIRDLLAQGLSIRQRLEVWSEDKLIGLESEAGTLLRIARAELISRERAKAADREMEDKEY